MSNVQIRRAQEETVDRVLAGIQQVVSFEGRSQYAAGGGGASTCGLAALNCARVILGRERDGLKGEELVCSMMGRETMEEILDICFRWTGSEHLDVDDIFETPAFRRFLNRERTLFERPGREQFLGLVAQLQETSGSCTAAVITRPPEIVAVLKIPCSSGPDVFAVFDSHPRKSHPEGAGLTFDTSLDSTADYLFDLLKFDEQLLEDESLQWQAQLLANYSAHIFTASESIDAYAISDAIIDASLSVLSLKAQVTQLTSDNTSAKAEGKQMRDQLDQLEFENMELRDQVRRLNATSKGKQRYSDGHHNGSSGRSSVPKGHSPSFVKPVTQRSGGAPSYATAYVKRSDDDYAQQLQRQFEEEDRQLRTQSQDLKAQAPSMFECGICLSEETEYMVFRFEPCGHRFCRDCVRRYVKSKIEEHRFPIACPTCTTSKDVSQPGTVDSSIAERIGLSEKEYALLTELELSTLSVLVHCRKCLGEIFVDKQEYQDAKVVACPLPKCTHAWCKACSQAIDFAGPPHSCDGSSELDHLMGQRGWKYCPGCRTPTEKMSGCNHMTCMTPGCNVHFCYICGQSIVQSAKRSDVKTAVSQHYRVCRLFEDVPDR